MAITENSKKIISRLIRKEFDSVDRTFDWISEYSDELINTAKDFELHDLANEMENDLKIGK
jgi:hypothetical protein